MYIVIAQTGRYNNNNRIVYYIQKQEYNYILKGISIQIQFVQ